MHYQRWKRHGDPLVSEIRQWPDNLLQRMRSQANGCIWLDLAPHYLGYAVLTRDGKQEMAHRLAYEHFVGPIPEGMTLDHECHNRDETCAGGPTCLHRRCVNWEHLTPKPIGENTNASPNSWSARTHCPKGHPYDEANTRRARGTGHRVCRTCDRLRRRAVDSPRVGKS